MKKIVYRVISESFEIKASEIYNHRGEMQRCRMDIPSISADEVADICIEKGPQETEGKDYDTWDEAFNAANASALATLFVHSAVPYILCETARIEEVEIATDEDGEDEVNFEGGCEMFCLGYINERDVEADEE